MFDLRGPSVKMEHRLYGLALSIIGLFVCWNPGVEAATTHATRPVTCTDKFAAVPNHTFCLANVHHNTMTDADRDLVLKLHNDLRESVDPPAANMLKLHYDKMLEQEAQIWAENCHFGHEPNYRRNIPGGTTVGQNIAVSYRSTNGWTSSIGRWAADKTKYHFKYGDASSRSSHYTQQIWAATTRIGCGMANCPGLGYMYVCNYAPSGNGGDVSRPYIEAKSGHSGELCPNKLGHNSKLCDCKGTVCNNGGDLNPNTCKCHCETGPAYADGLCTLSCAPNSDLRYCGRDPFTKSSCTKYSNAPVRCPWMCGRCPYIGPNYVEGSEPLPSEKDSNSMPIG